MIKNSLIILTIIPYLLLGNWSKSGIDNPKEITGRWVKSTSLIYKDRFNKYTLLGSSILGLAAYKYDQDVIDYFSKNDLLPNSFAETGRFMGGIPAPGIVYGIALIPYITGKSSGSMVYRNLEMITGAFATNTLIIYSLKFATGRDRPDKSNTRSFPSGHSANGFLMATLVNQIAGKKPGIPFYGLAAVIALSRLQHNKHHLSDIIVGSAIGYVVGRSFSTGYGQTEKRVSISPTMFKGQNKIIPGISLVMDL